jgi:hypothetical protein
MGPEQRRRLRAAVFERDQSRAPNRIRLGAAPRTRFEVPNALGRQCGRLDQVDELRAAQVRHDCDFNNFLRFASAWKKFAFTAPTDVPTISAI